MRTVRVLICARHLQCVVFFACIVAELKAAEKRVSAAELGVLHIPLLPCYTEYQECCDASLAGRLKSCDLLLFASSSRPTYHRGFHRADLHVGAALIPEADPHVWCTIPSSQSRKRAYAKENSALQFASE